MRKGKDFIGKPIVTYDSGKKIANIIDLIFDRSDNSLLGFLVEEGSWFSDAKVLPLSSVKALGNDAAIVHSRSAISSARNYQNIYNILEQNDSLNGTRVMTNDGRDLGKLVDFYFDEYSGTIEGYETSGGLFADAYSGRSFVPAFQTLKIGEDVAFVPSETITLMEERVGGLKVALQTANEKISQTTRVAGDRLQETAQFASNRPQDAGRLVNTKVTEVAIDRSTQKTFATGKIAQTNVVNPQGGCLVMAGEIITARAADDAERLGVLAELYRSAGGNLRMPTIEPNYNLPVASLSTNRKQICSINMKFEQ